jgi:hypothetical protein
MAFRADNVWGLKPVTEAMDCTFSTVVEERCMWDEAIAEAVVDCMQVRMRT